MNISSRCLSIVSAALLPLSGLASPALYGQAPPGVAQRTPTPGRAASTAAQPGGVTLSDGTRLVPATAPVIPQGWSGNDLVFPAQNSVPVYDPAASRGQDWYFQNSGPNGAGWYFYPGRGPNDLSYSQPKAFSATNPMSGQIVPLGPNADQQGTIDLSKRTTLDQPSGLEPGPSDAGRLPTYLTKREGKSGTGKEGDQTEALKAYAELLDKKADEQRQLMQQFGSVASGGGNHKADGLTVDPELALIQASINPRTGQPRQRASEISRSVGLSMVPAGTILHLRNVSRVQTQLGGTCLAILEQDVWDAQMRAIVLPRGSRVLGAIQQVSGDAQNRAAVVFRQIVDPNGDQVPLLVEQPAMNAIGMTGIEGAVNNHFGVKFGSALAWGLISGLAGSGSKSPQAAGSNFGDVVQSNVASSFGQVGQTYLQQTANIKADIEVAENTPMKIVIGSPIYLKPWREIRPF